MRATNLRKSREKRLVLLAFLLILAAMACNAPLSEPEPETLEPSPMQGTGELVTIAPLEQETIEPSPLETQPVPSGTPGAGMQTKWDLWIDGPNLRGANIYQRRVYPELDGPTYMGPGPVGPPYTQEDFVRLASQGANYVNISHPGLFDEAPPYALDVAIQDNLDALLDMIAQADMFAVISFRTGPGRSEFTFFYGEEGDWFDESYYNDSLWEAPEAQDAWVAMWRYTAERYRHHPIVVGYDLMVEPNSNEVWFDEWDPQAFYAQYGGSTYDWNPLAVRITAAIREVDPVTPILVGGNAYSRISWLPYLQPSGDPLSVYTVHQYAPHQYTHQEPGLLGRMPLGYPGEFDTDWDGTEERFDRAWLDDLLSIVDNFSEEHSVPMAVNEFGAVRWTPGVAAYMDDLMDLFEARGMNYALWMWHDSLPERADNDAFNFMHGPDPDNHQELETSDLIEVIRKYWRRNEYRPSNTPFR